MHLNCLVMHLITKQIHGCQMQEPVTCYIERLKLVLEFLQTCQAVRENLIQACIAVGINLPRWYKKVPITSYKDLVKESGEAFKVSVWPTYNNCLIVYVATTPAHTCICN
jgi:hypothetical protein